MKELNNIDSEQSDIQERIEEDVFWTLLCFIYFVMSRYYLFLPSLIQNIQGNKSKMHTPQLANKLVGIKSDIILLKVIIRDLNLELLKQINIIGLPLEYYFYDHILSAYSELFHPETIYRIWDILFYESSLGQEGNLTYLIVSIAYTLLIQAQQDLMKCRSPEQFEFTLKFHAYYTVIPHQFIINVLENQKKIISKQTVYINLISSFDEEISVYYQNRQQRNLILNDFINAKNKYNICEPVKLSELKQVVQYIYDINGPLRKKGNLIQAKIKQRDSLEIPDQFDDEYENEKYRLKDNLFLTNRNVGAKLYNPYYNTGGSQVLQARNNNIINTNFQSNAKSNNHHSIYQSNQDSYQQDSAQNKNYQGQRFPNSPYQPSIAGVPRQLSLQKFFIYIHQLKLFWSDCSEVQMEIFYTEDQRQEFKIIVDTSVPLSSFFSFQHINHFNQLFIRLYQDDSQNQSTGILNERVPIMEACIDLSSLICDFVMKTSIYLQPNPYHQFNEFGNANNTCVEVDLSLLLLSDRVKHSSNFNFMSNDPSSSTITIQKIQNEYEYPSNNINYFILYGESSLGIDYRVLLNLFKQDIAETPYFDQVSNSTIDPTFKKTWIRSKYILVYMIIQFHFFMFNNYQIG